MKVKTPLIALLLISMCAFGQTSREHIKTKIKTWETCKNVCITKDNGNIALYKKNGWAGGGIPEKLAERLLTINKEDKYLNDVQLTEDGKWFVHFGGNGMAWDGIPDALVQTLLNFNKQNEGILNVSVNDNAEWIAVTDAHVSASSNALMEKINGGRQRYGGLVWTHLTNSGMALVFESGFLFFGNVPSSLKVELGRTNINVKKLKFLNDGAYFIADSKGEYNYAM